MGSRLITLLLTVAIAACGGTEPEPERVPVLTRVSITPDSARVDLGKSAAFEVRGFDEIGLPMLVTFTWRTSPPTIASVTNGVVAALAPGKALLIASSGASSDTAVVVVPDTATALVGGTWRMTATEALEGRCELAKIFMSISQKDGAITGRWSGDPKDDSIFTMTCKPIPPGRTTTTYLYIGTGNLAGTVRADTVRLTLRGDGIKNYLFTELSLQGNTVADTISGSATGAGVYLFKSVRQP